MDIEKLMQNIGEIKVSQIMTKNVIKVNEDTNLMAIDDLFQNNKIHHLPVVNNENKLSGIISFTDFMLMKEWGAGSLSKGITARNDILMRSNLASDIMTSHPTTVTPAHTLSHVAELFIENEYKCVPVVNANNEIEGILTTYDLIVVAYTDFHTQFVY